MIRDPHPQRVYHLENLRIEKVICGSDQTYCIAQSSERRHVFSWGCNSYAKLGHSYKKTITQVSNKSSVQQEKTPTLIKELEGAEITDLSCGNSHTFAWSNQTQLVYGWGNGANGRLGNESDDIVTEPRILEPFQEAT